MAKEVVLLETDGDAGGFNFQIISIEKYSIPNQKTHNCTC